VRRADLEFPKDGSPVESQVTASWCCMATRAPCGALSRRADRRGLTRIAGSLQLDMRDFEIVPPSYLGVSVSPGVEVAIDLTVDGL